MEPAAISIIAFGALAPGEAIVSLWAGIIVALVVALAYITSDPSTLLLSLGELAAVIALFALICAVEARS
jgi:hypothetical protein